MTQRQDVKEEEGGGRRRSTDMIWSAVLLTSTDWILRKQKGLQS